MQQICEVCGTKLQGKTQYVEIDGAVFPACPKCQKLGRPAAAPRPLTRSRNPPALTIQPPSLKLVGFELELTTEFPKLIRQAREKIHLSQEDLGRKINEKPSVIRLLETGRLKPDDMLARKIERFLKINLLVASEEP